ncbi:alpha-ketoacid dehydrogenase subunit beta [Picrophilus oshimae]|uniref:Pyruvate dehydrogenase E1 component beta subunit n=1 Tax=Picrophilus torridus (strain ATCC 700027 / DSM 9790 / JCM 10055 / NBRC 100828 / KAW 2/3) TaxID=1122961 RepID=Q6L1L9_PICTO|nr:alpha-ketoacid dehydrogenase subunit beta [Picrophilus oshimae]AAT43133.1 pyruvate dehydrogenase E1 component beta subunit [Picrophilus oshimae DSM 9789]SMD30559.1 pyruvate dehydrogenase E1 component beta subunit [Picrophilus oshimae DSM 9789]
MTEMNMVKALNSALDTMLERDKNVILLGEDIAKDGGVFRVTDGLYAKYGGERVISTPLSELGIVGMGIGMAMDGLRPVPEIQFLDFIYTAMDQIVSQMAKIRYRTNGDYTLPMVLRTPYGGGVSGGPYHSQSSEAYFAHTAGLVVVTPSNPYDAKGLLISAIESNDPVMFLEPKRIYYSIKNDVPDNYYKVDIGRAKRILEGDDVTLITYGPMVPLVKSVVQKNNVNADVIDLITLNPFDVNSIINSVKRTGRAVIVHEAPKMFGAGAEIAATIAEKAIDYLQAPILRVTGMDIPVPFILEDYYVPNEKRIMNAINKVINY